MLRTITLALILVGQLTSPQINAQNSFSIGIGINSSLSIQPEDEKPYIGQGVPPWLISPGIVIKTKKNEFTLGPNFFMTSYTLLSQKYYFILSGANLDYKYHSLNTHKLNWFLSSTLQYSQFLNGTPITGYDAYPSLGSHSVYLKTVTVGNTLGGGLNLNLFSKLSLFTAINAGITYSKFDVVVDYNWREYNDQTKFNLICQARIGLTIDIYYTSKPGVDQVLSNKY